MRGVPGAVFVPAILGTAANNDVHNAIKDRTGHIVNEISSLPPAVTGLRLHALLLRLLKKYDVDLIEQSTITGAVVENGRCAALITTNNGQERRYEARSFIIATGGVLGEGFAIEPERAWEPIFNIDLPLNPSSPEWSLPEAYPACRQTPGTPRRRTASPCLARMWTPNSARSARTATRCAATCSLSARRSAATITPRRSPATASRCPRPSLQP